MLNSVDQGTFAIYHLITDKWKVAYEDMSLECLCDQDTEDRTREGTENRTREDTEVESREDTEDRQQEVTEDGQQEVPEVGKQNTEVEAHEDTEDGQQEDNDALRGYKKVKDSNNIELEGEYSSENRHKDLGQGKSPEDIGPDKTPKENGPKNGPAETGLEEGQDETGPEKGEVVSNNFLARFSSYSVNTQSNNNSSQPKNTRTTELYRTKSQSVPAMPRGSLDCLDCGGDRVGSRDHCSCPRKRKERQDSLHEHERKFYRSSSLSQERAENSAVLTPDREGSSSSLPPEREENSFLSSWNGFDQEERMREGVYILQEVQRTGYEEDYQKLDRKRKTTRRNKRTRRLYKENNRFLQEQDARYMDYSPGPVAGESQVTIPDDPPSGNSLRFLYGETEAGLRRSSSPFPLESPALSPHSYKRSSSTTDVGFSSDNQVESTWVSERLAHIMRVGPGVVCLDSEMPRPLHYLDTASFRERTVQTREVEGEKGKLKQLSKQLSNLKRKIGVMEQQLTTEQGYRPSQQDRLNYTQLKELLEEEKRLKQDLKQGKEVPEEAVRRPSTSRSLQQVERRLRQMLEALEQGRVAGSRPVNPLEMSAEQIYQEKEEIQHLLTDYEKEFGAPESKEEKEVLKELHDRYRLIKRLARRSSQRSGGKVEDLLPIPEDEELDLTLVVSPPTRLQVDLPAKPFHLAAAGPSRHEMDLPQFQSSGEGDQLTSQLWHAMSREELRAALRSVREDKKTARRAVKEFEERFWRLTGRRVTKDDREPVEVTYQLYKTSKSKLKLINALLLKLDGKVGTDDRYAR